MKIGIIGAISEEIVLLRDTMPAAKGHKLAGRTFYEGKIANLDAILVLAKIGKVASAITTTMLIRHFSVDAIIFTGVAGAIDTTLSVGDIVIANDLMQHDIDASPFFPKYQIPLLDLTMIPTSEKLTKHLTLASNNYLLNKLKKELSKEKLEQFSIVTPKIVHGTIVSGDQFIRNNDVVARISNDIPTAKCVEMEGAAVAQVCYEFEIPFAVLRVISDKANHDASIDFASFLEITGYYTRGILLNLSEHLI